MALDALLALRDVVASDAALNSFFIEHYNKPATHIIGYKRSQNANDYPCFCYVPVSSSVEDVNDRLKASIVIGVNEPLITDGMMYGHVRLNSIIGLLEPIITIGTIDSRTIIFPNYQLVYDFGERHPFYEIELQLQLTWRRSHWI